MLLAVVMVLAAVAIWRIGKSVFAPAPAAAREPGPGVGVFRPVPVSPPPIPVLPTRSAAIVAVPPSWAVPGGDEPVVRFTQPPARLARGSASPPVGDTRLVERLAIPVPAARPPVPPAEPATPRRRQGLYHVSHPAHGLDEVPRRRKP